MATAGRLRSVEPFKCSICLEVFTRPVSTSCGHNFCSECIQNYWDTTNTYQCPYCRTKFTLRPKLQVNSLLNELVEESKASAQLQGPDSALMKNLEERRCKTHRKPREMYCRTDGELICTACFPTDHQGHNVVPLMEEFELVAAKTEAAVIGLQKVLKEHFHNILELEMLVEKQNVVLERNDAQ